MRRSRLVHSLILLSALAAACLFAPRVTSTPAPAAHKQQLSKMAADLAEGSTAPDQAYLDERLGTSNQPLAPETFTNIGRQAQSIKTLTAAQDPTDGNQQWNFEGPTNIDNPHPPNTDGGGRVTDLAVDPHHAGTVYIASASGGVWKTTDGGASATNMQSVWPIGLPQAIGAIAVAPDGTVYAGTGETNPGGGSITFYGGGVYRSIDVGAHWTNIGLDQSWTVGRIVVNPTNSNQVWVAASGNLFIGGDENTTPAQQRGLYVTNNAEATSPTWTLSLGPANDTTGTLNITTGAVDIAMAQQTPGTSEKTIYVAFWDHLRSPNTWAYTGPGSSVWKTTDGGNSWTDLTAVANTATDHLIADHNTDVGRIGVAVAPSNDSYVYVNYANETEGAQVAFFTSTNGGTSFTEDTQTSLNLAENVTSASYVYGWWFAKTFVDPANPQHVFITGLCLWESTNAASSSTDDCNVHADQHAMAWDPGDSTGNTVYLGDDGGFYKSTQNGVSGSFVPAVYEPWTQFDGLAVGYIPGANGPGTVRLIGGLQDNGSQRNWNSAGTTVAPNQWNSVFGGDGQQNVINPQNTQIVYSCLQYGVCQVSDDGGNTGTEFDTTPLSLNQTCTTCTTTTRNAYFTPIALDPTHPNIAYYGGDEMNESQDNGNTWQRISSNLGGPNTGSNTDPLYAGHFGAATAIAVSQSNGNVVWVGTDSGCLWFTSDALTDNSTVSWTNVSGSCGPSATPPSASPLTTSLPTQFVSKILIDPANPQNVFVAFSGYRSGDNSAYVERTTDGGNTWTNLTGNLPAVTVNSLALVNGRLYAANDTGVYVTTPGANPLSDASLSWDQVGNNLPGSPVTALVYSPGNQTLYASTFGRGVWSLSLAQPNNGVPETATPLLLPAVGGVAGLAAAFAVRVRRRRRLSQTH
ncbi:MAG: hypothetical protein JOY80_09510 [Candidatus Dormibacteraeota bacterium]|nr:hypothetical protein [Candidatus Dormibacteraeota bacterium]